MVWIPLRWGVLDTALCDKVCQWLAAGRWFSPGSPVSSTNKTDHLDVTEISLKVALNTIILTLKNCYQYWISFSRIVLILQLAFGFVNYDRQHAYQIVVAF